MSVCYNSCIMEALSEIYIDSLGALTQVEESDTHSSLYVVLTRNKIWRT
jgi:hypothetical protein